MRILPFLCVLKAQRAAIRHVYKFKEVDILIYVGETTW